MTKADATWFSPVEIVDSAILGVAFDVDERFADSKTECALTMGLTMSDSKRVKENCVCKCVLEVSCEWRLPEDDSKTAFSASCKVGLTVAVDGRALMPLGDAESKTFIAASAVSIAYGKIRCVIEGITAESLVGRQTIPAIDPYAYLESIGFE